MHLILTRYVVYPLIIALAANFLGFLVSEYGLITALSIAVFVPALVWVAWNDYQPFKAIRDESLKKYSARVLLAAIMLICFLVMLFPATKIAILVVSSDHFVKYNLFGCMLLIFLILQFALHPKSVKNNNWQKLSDHWLEIPTISAVAIGGFGAIEWFDKTKFPWLIDITKSPYTNEQLLILITLVGIIFLLAGKLFSRVGMSSAADLEGRSPVVWFAITFSSAFISNILLYSVLIDCIILTIHAHMAS